MGTSNHWLLPAYRQHLIENLNINKKPNIKIAWLGQQEYGLENVAMFDHLGPDFKECQHDFYDIANEDSWDVHDNWDDIRGYDLVLALRLTFLVKSSSHLLREMKKAVENNGAFYTDFCSGNIRDNTVSWNSDNLVCFLPEYWPHQSARTPSDLLKYEVQSPDNLLTKQMLADHSLKLKNYICLRDQYKNRLQILTQVVKI